MKPRIEIFTNTAELARAAAHSFLAHSRDAESKRGNFTVALSGGSTPKSLYKLLADPNEEFRDQLLWDRTHFFWTDERHVGPDHPDSNYRMANEAMLAHVPVPNVNVHRMPGERTNAEEAALDYESEIVTFFAKDGLPRFDLILLGLGTDGHTASIFPGSEVLQEKRRLIAAPWVDKLNSYRLTMTLPLLNNAATIAFLVSGTEKAEILREVLQGAPSRFPAQEIKPTNGELNWLVDSAAAEKLVDL